MRGALARGPRFGGELVACLLGGEHLVGAALRFLGGLLAVLLVCVLDSGEALLELRDLDRLPLGLGQFLGELRLDRFAFGFHLVEHLLQVVDRLRRVGELALGLGALLAGRADDLGDPALGGLDRLVVELDCERGDPLGERLGHGRDGLGDLDRELGDRLDLGGLFAGEVLFPHLAQARRVAAADLLPESEAGDVAACGLDGLAGGDDLFGGVFGWAHDGISSTEHHHFITNKEINKLTNKVIGLDRRPPASQRRSAAELAEKGCFCLGHHARKRAQCHERRQVGGVRRATPGKRLTGPVFAPLPSAENRRAARGGEGGFKLPRMRENRLYFFTVQQCTLESSN